MLLTPLGFGSWAVGGPDSRYNWGPQDDRESENAIRRALDQGINWIDTAPIYGCGHSEEVVGRVLRGRTDRPYVFTKCSLLWDEKRNVTNCLRADSVRRECEASLKRLGVETIDLYQVHWPNPEGEIEEGWQEMARLKREGKVRWIGVSNFNVDQMKRAQALAPVTSLQPPYSAVRPGVEKEILPYCKGSGLGVLVYSPMQAGLLSGGMTRQRVDAFPSGDWRRQAEEFKEPRLTRNLALQDLLGGIAKRGGHTAAVAALAWVLRREEVTGAIVGARRASQVDGFIAAMEWRLTPEEIKEIDQFICRTF